MSNKKRILIKSKIARVLVSITGLMVCLLFISANPSFLVICYFLAIFIAFPMPLALFGRFPPNNYPDVPVEYLNNFQRLEVI